MRSSPLPRLLLLVLCVAPACLHAASPDAPLPTNSAVSSAELPNAPTRADEPVTNLAAELTAPALTLPSAPRLSSSLSPSFPIEFTPAPTSPLTSRERDLSCQAGRLHGKPCRAAWGPILWEALEATAIENAGNIVFDSDTRNALMTHPYWSTWIECVHKFRYDQWRDDDGFGVDYIGHGMQGAVVAMSFEQHSPTGRGLVYLNNGNYWRNRLKAMAWIAAFEVQWKLGPAGEASVGSAGINSYYTPRVHGRTTNETGFQDLVDTPIVGFWWSVGEDALDRWMMPHIWQRTHNKWILTALFPLTPCKAAANILRFKPFYYRDFDLPPVRAKKTKLAKNDSLTR